MNRVVDALEPRTFQTGTSDEELLAALPPRTGRREVWVGLFVMAGILAALVALLTLTDAAMFRGRYFVYTTVENAAGIRRGDPVQMRGVNIGRVHKFEMVPGAVRVRLELERDYDVPADSRVVLRSSGILGGMVAEVVPGVSERDVGHGDVLPGATEGGPFAAAADIGSRADTVLTRVQAMLSTGTVEAIREGALELRVLLGELAGMAAEQRRELAVASRSLRASAQGIERAAAGPELERVVARLDAMTARLDEATTSLGTASRSLEQVLGRLERGEGTLGRLSVDESLYENLNQAAAAVNRLAEDIRLNPRRYIDLRVF